MKDNVVFEYYYIKNSTSEWHSDVTGNFATLDAALEGIKERFDWYCSKGTGDIYRRTFIQGSNGELDAKDVIVFSRTQCEVLHNLPGTFYNK